MKNFIEETQKFMDGVKIGQDVVKEVKDYYDFYDFNYLEEQEDYFSQQEFFPSSQKGKEEVFVCPLMDTGNAKFKNMENYIFIPE